MIEVLIVLIVCGSLLWLKYYDKYSNEMMTGIIVLAMLLGISSCSKKYFDTNKEISLLAIKSGYIENLSPSGSTKLWVKRNDENETCN